MVPAPQSALKKKNDVEVVSEPLPEPTPPPSPVAELTAENASQPPLIEWKPGCEQELHASVIARTTDTTSASLRRVAATAIAEPNILEFSFPANYDLDRRGCDCPEVTAQLERIVSELVGQPTVVRFKTVVVAQEAPTVADPKPGANNPKVVNEAGAIRPRNGFIEAPDDAYVQSVMALFGVKGWRVQQMAAEPIADGEVEPTRED